MIKVRSEYGIGEECTASSSVSLISGQIKKVLEVIELAKIF